MAGLLRPVSPLPGTVGRFGRKPRCLSLYQGRIFPKFFSRLLVTPHQALEGVGNVVTVPAQGSSQSSGDTVTKGSESRYGGLG